MSKEKPYLIPFILFIFSFILRLSLISKGPYHIDCFDLAMKSQATLDTLQLHYLYGSGYPFAVILGALFILFLKPFGISDPILAVNFMSVTFGALCIPTLYLVTQKLFNKTAAVFSALILSVMPTFLGVSVYGKNHAPGIFFLLLAIYFLILYTENRKFPFLLLASFSTGLLGATRIQDLGVMIPSLSFLYFQTLPSRATPIPIDKRQLWKNFFTFWAIAGILMAVLHFPYFLQKDAANYNFQSYKFYQIFFQESYAGFDRELMAWGLHYTKINLTWGGLCLAIIGFTALSRRLPRIFCFLLMWFSVSFLLFSNLNTTVERYLITSYIPLGMALGYGLERLSSLNQRGKFAAMIIFFMLFSKLLTDIYPALLFRHRHALLPDYGHWVATRTEPNAVIIIGDENAIIQHYGHRKTLHNLVSIYHLITDKEFVQYKKTLDQYLAEDTPLYITETGLVFDNPDHAFERFLRKNYRLHIVGQAPLELWYQGESYHDVFPCHLLQIIKK